MTTLPTAKLPSWNVPAVRSLPSIPNVGCVSGNATTQIGEQFGNFPDVQALPHIKALLFEARKARLITELTNIVSTATTIAGQVAGEINAAIDGCNEKISDLNAAKAAVMQTPENMRSLIQRKTLERYDEYIGEVNDQMGRLQTALACLN
jgi:hypothetical protein